MLLRTDLRRSSWTRVLQSVLWMSLPAILDEDPLHEAAHQKLAGRSVGLRNVTQACACPRWTDNATLGLIEGKTTNSTNYTNVERTWLRLESGDDQRLQISVVLE